MKSVMGISESETYWLIRKVFNDALTNFFKNHPFSRFNDMSHSRVVDDWDYIQVMLNYPATTWSKDVPSLDDVKEHLGEIGYFEYLAGLGLGFINPDLNREGDMIIIRFAIENIDLELLTGYCLLHNISLPLSFIEKYTKKNTVVEGI